MKLEIQNSKKIKKFTNTWKLNKTLSNNHWLKEEVIKKFFERDK